MPELGELTRALNDDLNAVRWPEAPQIRDRGQQRQRRGRLLAVAVVAAVAVAGIGAAGLTHPSSPSAPGASGQPTDSPPQVDPSAIEYRVMAAALLSPKDFAPRDFVQLAPTTDAPLRGCADDAPLAREDLLLSSEQAAFADAAGGDTQEMIMLYRPGSAISGIKYDLADRLADACKDVYSPAASGFAGDASQMIAVQAQSMPPRVEVFVASRDYLIWLRVAGPFDNLHDYARQLARRTVAKLNCAITGQSTC